MSGHIVIGAGVAGQHHIRVLSGLGREKILVLDAAQDRFRERLDRALATERGDAIWHVCTPTDTHIDYLRQILQADPSAAVLLEKPIGRPGESTVFSLLASGSAVMVQSQYSYSLALEALTDSIPDEAAADHIRIEVDFEKNRLERGRFQDVERQAIGYEGFHQIAIALRLLERLKGNDFARGFAQSARLESVSNNVGGYLVSLAAPNVVIILKSRLDSKQRRSVIEISGREGTLSRLVFETPDWFTGTPRQTHLVLSGGREFLFEEDLMHSGVTGCTAALASRNMPAVMQNQQMAIEIEMLLDHACRKPNPGRVSSDSNRLPYSCQVSPGRVANLQSLDSSAMHDE